MRGTCKKLRVPSFQGKWKSVLRVSKFPNGMLTVKYVLLVSRMGWDSAVARGIRDTASRVFWKAKIPLTPGLSTGLLSQLSPPPWAHGILQFWGYDATVIICWLVWLCQEAVGSLWAASVPCSALHPPQPGCNRCLIKVWRKLRYWEKW